MNIAVLDARPTAPSARTLMDRALEPHLLIGMPHLTAHGLSRTWLLKELGHRHWLMLALRLGMENADFRTADGREAYASICATSMQDYGRGLAGARANDVLEIRSSLVATLRSRHASRHALWIDGQRICEVELVSTFVARERPDDNHALVRVQPALSEPCGVVASALATMAAGMRKKAADLSAQPAGIALPTLTPDPGSDFNGAGLLYFANFQTFFERALGPGAFDETARLRRVFFFGNAKPGEALTFQTECSDTGREITCHMRRRDGKVIATYQAFV